MPNINIKKIGLYTLQASSHLFALLFLLYLLILIPAGALGGDPVKELIHYLGIGALRLLLLCLLVSPLASYFHWPALVRLRRPLGLWCFVWASLHFLVWLALDLGFDWSLIGREILNRTYIIVGFIAWLIFVALAVTSIPSIVRSMARRWKQLHGLIYLQVLLVCLHFFWSVKSSWYEPLAYTMVAIFLLIIRRKKVKRWLKLFINK